MGKMGRRTEEGWAVVSSGIPIGSTCQRAPLSHPSGSYISRENLFSPMLHWIRSCKVPIFSGPFCTSLSHLREFLWFTNSVLSGLLKNSWRALKYAIMTVGETWKGEFAKYLLCELPSACLQRNCTKWPREKLETKASKSIHNETENQHALKW